MDNKKLKTLIMLAKQEPVRQLTQRELQQRCEDLAAAVVELGYTRPRTIERLAALEEGGVLILDCPAVVLRELWDGLKRDREGIDIEIEEQQHGTCRVYCYSVDEPTPLFIKMMLVASFILATAIYFL